MKAPCALPLVAATGALAQNFNSGSFTGTATVTISGSTYTVGGTNAATFTIGSSTVTVGGTSTDSSTDAAVTTAASDDGTSSDEEASDDSSSSAAASSSSGSGNNNFDSLTSGYTGSPITVEFGSSTITLGSYASGGFSNSANATATFRSSSTADSGSDAGTTDGSGSATATPSGPTTSLPIATTPPNSGAGAVEVTSGLLGLIGLVAAFVL
ncbi:hypothetical protein GGR58DRAFT_25779 [Xylaria digitata]|nr:hypothetical protein GGR58DRAFT_25779 [Xylaria digitata]